MKLTKQNIKKMSKERVAERLEKGLTWLKKNPNLRGVGHFAKDDGTRCAVGACFPEFQPADRQVFEKNSAMWEFVTRLKKLSNINVDLTTVNDVKGHGAAITYMEGLLKLLRKASNG